MTLNALYASTHPCYIGSGYKCDCGEHSKNIAKHRKHLLYNPGCIENNAALGDIEFIERKLSVIKNLEELILSNSDNVQIVDIPDRPEGRHSRILKSAENDGTIDVKLYGGKVKKCNDIFDAIAHFIKDVTS